MARERKTTTSSATSDKIATLRIDLVDSRPRIWREIEVPVSLTLLNVHDVVQIAFGWEDSHLHEFQVGARRFGRRDVGDGWAEAGDTENENGATLSQVMRRKGAKLLYVKSGVGGKRYREGVQAPLDDDALEAFRERIRRVAIGMAAASFEGVLEVGGYGLGTVPELRLHRVGAVSGE